MGRLPGCPPQCNAFLKSSHEKGDAKKKNVERSGPVAQDGEKDFGANSQRVSELQPSRPVDHRVGEDNNISICPKNLICQIYGASAH